MYDAQNYSGGDGSSFDLAIKVLSDNSSVGVASEYAYLAQYFKGADISSQAVVERDGRNYDVFKIVQDGTDKEVYFDISDFYGKDFGDFITNLLK